MKLTMKAVGWSSTGQAMDQREESVLRYEVQGLPGSPDVSIDATTTAQEGETWRIYRDGKPEGAKYPTAQEALATLEAFSQPSTHC